MGWKEKLRARDRVLIVLSKKHCLSLEELEELTGLPRKRLLVTLSRLTKAGIITRTWGS
ncbi:MAG: hypothetical protein JHC26_05165, partial [Thermofilum sp.]|nr:hypothetical protein [Thermofilum sp.]